MNRLTGVLNLALLLIACGSAFGADYVVRQIEIKSYWGGLGTPQKTALVIRNDKGTYRLGRKQVDVSSVKALIAAAREPVIGKPSLQNLGLTREWLEQRVAGIPNESPWRKLKEGTPQQKALFTKSFTDPNFIAKILPTLFVCCHTDDYPSVEVTISYDDGAAIVLSSHSQSDYMLPWKVESNGTANETFNRNISNALVALMPKKATNLDRIVGDRMDVKLAEAVMRSIEEQWNLIGAEAKDNEALARIRGTYKIVSADVSLYHDVAFGVYSKEHDGTEENLHVLVTRQSFPAGFYENAILVYKDDKVWGVEEFLGKASRFEDLALSVPWLAQLRMKYPKWGTTLLWVHNTSFSDKAMQNFAADMHLAGKDGLAEEVRRVQQDVAVLNIGYGDYWLILPDRRMVLWRYESVSGLLGFKHFAAHKCADYQGVSGGCVGAVVSPEGELVN
jgi:hypothetical protein